MKGDTIETLCDLQRNAALAAADWILKDAYTRIRDAAGDAIREMCTNYLGVEFRNLDSEIMDYLEGYERKIRTEQMSGIFAPFGGAICAKIIDDAISGAKRFYIRPPEKGTEARKQWDRLSAAKRRADSKAGKE